MPIQQILPNGKVRIFNNKTGQTAEVDPEQLGQYNPRLIGEYNQMKTYSDSVKSGSFELEKIPEGIRPGVMSSLNATGYKPKTQAEKDLELSRVKSRPDAQNLYGGFEKLKQQAADTDIGDVALSTITGGNYGTDANKFEQSRKLLGQTVARLYEQGRLSDKDRDFYQNEILNVGAIGRQGAIEDRLNNLRDDILMKAGFKAEDFGGKREEKKPQNDFLGGLAKNAVREVNNVGQGMIDTYEYAKQSPENATRVMEQIIPQNMIPNAVRGTIDAVKEYAPVRFKDGKPIFDISKTAETAYNKPLQTAAMVAPFVKPALKMGGDTVKNFVTRVPKPSRGSVQNFAEGTTELVTGGGPKEYIANNVNLDSSKTMSKVLLDENILSEPTGKGRIIKTQEGLTRSGTELSKKFKGSKEVVRGSDIGQELGQNLISKYGAGQQEAINTILENISQQGKYNLAANDSILSMDDLWSLSKNAGNFKAKAFNLPNNGPLLKDMASETERFLRQKLYSKVPEAQGDLRTYHGLRTYMDKVLTDPQGLNITSLDRLTQFLTSKLNTGIEMGAQKLYNMAGGAEPQVSAPSGQLKKFDPFTEFKSPAGGTKTPLEGAKPPSPEQRTIKRDMRYKQGNFKPRN